MIVDTFIIGAPKCGTTALANYISEHPEACVAKGKETHYFITDCYDKWQKRSARNNSDFHARYFSDFDPSRHKTAVEATPMQLFSKAAVGNILKYNPEARFIVMLRNPVELAQSLHSQLLWNRNSEIEKDFERAWHLQEERMSGKSIPKGCDEPLELQYGEICALGDQCERLLAQVDKSRILFLRHKDLKLNSRKVYLEALRFLGLTDDGRSEFPVVNERKAHSAPWLLNLVELAVRLRRALIPGKSLGLGGVLMDMEKTSSKPATISAELREELSTAFRPQIEKVRELTGLNISEES